MHNYPEELAASEERCASLQSENLALKARISALEKRVAELEAIVSGAREQQLQSAFDALKQESEEQQQLIQSKMLRHI